MDQLLAEKLVGIVSLHYCASMEAIRVKKEDEEKGDAILMAIPFLFFFCRQNWMCHLGFC